MRNNKRREKIIQKSEPIFARFGFKKTTMDNIAENLRLRKGTLYYYFKSKEEIFFAVIEKECDKLKKYISEEIEKENDPRQQLLNFFSARMQYFERIASYFTAFKSEYFEAITVGEEILKKYFSWEEETVRAIIKKGSDQGVFNAKGHQLAIITSAFMIALKGMEYQNAINEDTKFIRKNIKPILNTIYKGIEKKT